MLTSNSNEETILEQALGFSSSEARQAYLQGACGGDQALRARIESLIAAHEEAGAFLQQKTTRVSPDPSAGRADEQAGSVISRYKLLQQIGEGGCGVVYMAEQEEPVRRRVALKVIKLGMDTKSVIARFEAERQALALMDHPNIAKVLDAGATDSGRPYFVMELVRGIKITEYCDQNNLATKERLGLFIQVCHAIQHAHQKGIIHRDIKPSNILVSMHDGVPVPVVIDFGIAKATEQRLTDKTLFTAFEQFIGTPAYTSPEQAEMSRLDIDTRSDIYSLGVLLYEMLTGRPPFDPKELMASGLDVMRRTIREQEPPRPSTRLATLVGDDLTTVAKRRSAEPAKLIHLLRGDLDWIVMKCLEKDRTRRYDTANGLAMDLSRYLTDEPVLARPPSAAYRFQKALRRHKLAYAAAAAVAISLVGGLGLSTWLWRRESEAHDRAATAERDAQAAQAKETALRQEAEKRLYAANLNLVQQAWNDDNIVRMRRLLAETAGSPYRGWEWNYWQRQIHRELMTLRGHERELSSVAWSPDGQRIVTGSFDDTAKVWNAATGHELITLRGHTNWVIAVAFSADGQRLVTGGADRTVRVWETATGRELVAIAVPNAPAGSVAFSPDGRRIASGGYSQDNVLTNSTARVWDATTGAPVVALEGHKGNVNAVAFTPDGSRVVTASEDHTARVWDATTGRELLAFDRHPGAVLALAISADGRRVVSGGRGDWGVRVWELATGREQFVLRGHSSAVNAVVVSRDGRRIASAGDDTTVRVWDGITGDALFTLKGHGMAVNGLAFSPGGQRLISAAGDWMNLSPPDRSARIWDPVQQHETVVLGQPGGSWISSAPVSPDGTRVATGSPQSVRLWEATNGTESELFRANRNATGSVAFSSDGRKIVTRGRDPNIAIVWDALSGQELVNLRGHDGRIQYAAFSPNGRQIATGSSDTTARLWDSETGQTQHVLRGHREWVFGLAFSPDGHRLVTTGQDRTAKVWNVADGSEVFTYRGHSQPVTDVAFSPDGERVVTTSSDLTAKVWEAATGKDLFALEGHRSQVWAAAYTPDGRRIITGGYDGTAKVWDAADGRELLTLRGHLSYIRRVASFPDGRRFVTASWDGTARIWEAATDEQVAAWASQER